MNDTALSRENKQELSVIKMEVNMLTQWLTVHQLQPLF